MRLIEKNTKKVGNITIFTYKKGKKYLSICLELDIIKEGDKLQTLNQEMIEAVIGHVETVCKGNLSDDLLNRPAPEKYWQAYDDFIKAQGGKQTKPVGSFNRFPINELCHVT